MGYGMTVLNTFCSIRFIHAITPLLLLLLAANGMAASATGNVELSRASAWWLDATTLAWDGGGHGQVTLASSHTAELEIRDGALHGGASIALVREGVIDGALADRFPHLQGMPAYRLAQPSEVSIPDLLKTQLALVASDADGRITAATAIQKAGVLDELFAYDGPLGVTFERGNPVFRLWTPTARRVSLLLFESPVDTSPAQVISMQGDKDTGVWQYNGKPDWKRKFFLYEVEVFVRSTGRIEVNRVTDPYAVSLSMDSRYTQIVDLAAADLLPAGWDSLQKPLVEAPEDIILYELHVRDFSIGDDSVPAAARGTFAAFKAKDSRGMRHLRRLANAGLSHVHLLPAFDCATIPENPADQLEPGDLSAHAPDSTRQQAAVAKVQARDGFNWCYDPYHYTVPEGSYATDPQGVQRILEFREMVAALNHAGLRVVMDVVYNHTTTSGQAQTSVLDRIVPDYYQRLDANGEVETSTCCANTATEHRMMEKLMVDSLLTWAKAYRVDGFRFDLMGHHSRANIEKVRDALHDLSLEKDGVDGPSIYLYGEGWNFGEVADNARFVQATQGNMGQGTGVGTFNDRLRDAVRGGEHDDRGLDHVRAQGFVNGLYYDPNAENTGSDAERDALLHAADLVRAGLAGSLVDFRFENRLGRIVSAAEVDYHGQPAAYASDPQEVINYVAAHDNETLWDINQYKLPDGVAMADRVRVQNLANSIVALAQGIPFFHAGQELLRSKSLDRNSFDSGDWFNLLDFSYRDNGWGRGLPLEGQNAANWPVAGPLLANPDLKPTPEHIGAARTHFEELLAIRNSSPLFRLRDAAAVNRALRFHNTGPDQVPGLIVMSIERNDAAAVVLINATKDRQVYKNILEGSFALHPLQRQSRDARTREARVEEGVFHAPPRTTVVFMRQ